MIFWQGGFKALLPLGSIIAVIVTTAFFKVDLENPVLLTLIVSVYSALTWLIGSKINQAQETIITDENGNTFINKKTGEALITQNKNLHKMYWIPIQYWAFIIPILSFLFFKDLNTN